MEKDKLSKDDDVWVEGRAFVYAEAGEVEYFSYFLSDAEKEKCGLAGDKLIKATCGGIRQLNQCRPLDYVR